MGKQVIILGAGMSGMATAALLAKAGHRVTVLEKNDRAGGRVRVEREAGFTFDMGPTWYLMPGIFDNFFAQFGKNTADYYHLQRLTPCFRVFEESGQQRDVPSDPEALRALFAELEPDGARKLDRYLAEARHKYDVALSEFLYKDYRRLSDFFNRRMLLEGTRLNVFQSLDRYARRFFTNPSARRILLYNIVFLGGTPRKSPALFSLMSHVDLTLGVFYPEGGMWKVADALQALCTELGVRFLFNHAAQKIEVQNRRAVQVHGTHDTFPADAVVATGDYPWCETHLLERKHQTYPASYWKRRLMAPSMFLVYLGLNKTLPAFDHHNFFFPSDWNPHFDSMTTSPAWPDHPACYVGCPTRTDPSLAPPGKDVLFVLIPVAPGLSDTPEIRQIQYDRILRRLETQTGERITPHIEVRRIFAHNDFIQHYHAYEGTALGLAHTLFQSAVFRPANQSRKVHNLYYAGQYANPGIGLPMALISAQITANRLQREEPA